MWSRLRSRLHPQDAFFNASVERLLSAIRELKTRHGLDVLEIEELFGWSWRIAREKLVPLVVRLHGPWFLTGDFVLLNNSESRNRIELEGRGIYAATLVTAPSAAVLHKVRIYYKAELERVRIVPNPIDVGTAAAWEMNACHLNRILYVGRFDQLKGGDIVLRAFAALAQYYPDLRLVCGSGPKEFSRTEICYRLNEFVRKHLPASCWSRIDFYGQMLHQEVMELRNQHIFTIVASQFEVLSYAVLEAMSSGCPVVDPRPEVSQR